MCKNKKCTGSCSDCKSSGGNYENIIAQLQEQIETLTESVKPFICGHPILLIQNSEDIAQFDGDGYGVGCWEGWAICNGGSYYNSKTKSNFTTPNWTDRFIVHAGGNYSVGDTGGLDSVTLDVTQIPAHNHGITDAGHTHNVTDPGHNHPIDDPGHDHAGSGGSHTHTFTTNSSGEHNHSTVELNNAVTDDGSGAFAANNPLTYSGGALSGAHTHSGTTDPAASAVTVNSAFTGVQTQNAFTGITETDSANTGVTINEAGGGQAHENRPPYYASLYVVKMW